MPNLFCGFFFTSAKCVFFYLEVITNTYSKSVKSFKKNGEDYEEIIETNVTEKKTTGRKIKRFKSTNGHEESHDGSDRRGDRGGARIPLSPPRHHQGARVPETPLFLMTSVAAPVTPGGLYFHGPVREHSPVNHWVYMYN